MIARPVLLALGLLSAAVMPALAQMVPDATPAPAPTATPAVVGAPQGTRTVFVPKGTPIVVETVVGLSSYGARTGEKVDYVVAQDVVIDGYLIAKAGDSAQGLVEEARRGKAPGFFGDGYQAADLRLSVTDVYNFCGDDIRMMFDRVEHRRRQGLFGSNADVQVVKGQPYAALVSRPQKICGVPTTEQPLPIAPDVIQMDTK